MSNSTVLQAKQINHEQSEIWLEDNGQELTPHRALATNKVVNVVRCHVTGDVYKAFYTESTMWRSNISHRSLWLILMSSRLN